MHDEIKQRIQQHINAHPRGLIRRGAAPQPEDHYAALLAAHAKTALEQVLRGRPVSKMAGGGSSDPGKPSPQVRAQLSAALDNWLLTGSLHGAPGPRFDIVVNGGSSIVAPPYDFEWAIGRGLAFGSKLDGKFLTVNQPVASGESCAGVGMILRPEVTLLASITPQGTYSASWLAVENLPPGSWTTGGLGVQVYDANTGAGVGGSIITLWTAYNMTQFTGATTQGQLATASSIAPSGPFGPPTLGITVTLEAGVPYVYWVWAWQADNAPDNAGFLAIENVTLSFVSINAGPPPVIH